MGLRLIKNEKQFLVQLASSQYEWLRGLVIGLCVLHSTKTNEATALGAMLRPVIKIIGATVVLEWSENELAALMSVCKSYHECQFQYLSGLTLEPSSGFKHLNYGLDELNHLSGLLESILVQANRQGWNNA